MSENYVAFVSPSGVTMLSAATRKAPAQPYIMRREYAKPNFKQTRIYQACRLWVAMLRMGLA